MLSQIDLKKLFDASRIFETTPGATGLYLYSGIVFACFLVVGTVFLVLSRQKKLDFERKFFSKITNLFLVTGLLGGVWMFFRWQEMPYIGSRFAIYILGLFFVLWIVNILVYKFFILPKIKEQYLEKERFEKYLPTGKIS
jgi:hypothetical protein